MPSRDLPGLRLVRNNTAEGICLGCGRAAKRKSMKADAMRKRRGRSDWQDTCGAAVCKVAWFKLWRRDQRNGGSMDAVEKALRHIEKLVAARNPPQIASKKRKARRVITKSAYRVTESAHMPPRTEPDITPVYASLPAVFGPALPPIEWSITADSTRAVPPMTDEEALKLGILPDGELLDDVLDAEPGRISPALYVPPVAVEAPKAPPLPVTRPHWAAAFEAAGPPVAQAPQAAPSTTARTARGSCKAVCAKSGRQCRLLAHPETPDNHRNERGAFHLVLQPGQVPVRRQALDEVATRSNAIDYSQAELAPTKGTYHPRRDRVGRPRKSAHAGDATTTGLSSIDAGATL